jgi:protein-tyrosine-phosphatase
MAAGTARFLVDTVLPERSGIVKVASAGTAALDGDPATGGAQAAMRMRGVDISSHRARSVTEGMIAASDLVLTMEERQSSHVRSLEPSADVFLLLEVGEAARSFSGEVPDEPRERLAALVRTARELELEGLLLQPDGSYEVSDPIGWPLQEYERVADTMAGPIRDILTFLLG